MEPVAGGVATGLSDPMIVAAVGIVNDVPDELKFEGVLNVDPLPVVSMAM
jgi:hypothetical protein